MQRSVIHVLLIDGSYETYQTLSAPELNQNIELFISDPLAHHTLPHTRQHPDCIVLDSHPTAPQNMDLLTQLKKNNHGVPVIVLADNQKTKRVLRDMQLDNYHLLNKNKISSKTLHDTICEMVKQQTLEDYQDNKILQDTDPFDFIQEESFTVEQLYAALEKNQFNLCYQPIFHLHTELIAGVEALIRWEHPTMGEIYPDSFIPLAERSGLIVPIGKWVFVAACLQSQRWHKQRYDMGRVFINMSMLQLLEQNFLKTFLNILKLSHIEPSQLGLDLTDISLINDIKESAGILSELRDLGIHLAIDDFGTGYTSISYLKKLPVNALKIDRSLLENIPNDPRDSAIVRSLINTSKRVGAKIYAKAIERPEQHQFLLECGCDLGQGFLLSPPLPPADATQFFNKLKQGCT